MTSFSAEEESPNLVIIPDESDTQNTATASDSTQTAGRPLSTSGYVEATGVLVQLNTSAHGASSSQKRKRTKSKELSDLDHTFKKLRSTIENELDILRKENLKLENEICEKKDKNQKLQDEVFQLSKKSNNECKICYKQEEKWTVLVCGHMFCWPCVESLKKPRKCPFCRADVMGYFACYPFAG